ncbi:MULTISPECIES: hypothetical protein [Mobiluncus]|uniref:Uncharacterized protein n=3 Tax=Mobiluncus TaxID=2050 RepID=D6ZKA3_MOBCV|nr:MULTISPECIES: hypothetical protein [Mobiluncus]ADI67152.1 hypothetical protein HMPREF0573_10833 [Mobiluncus curtisii ATCC 43063]EFL93339.1 hypothetical protein HMPREF0574_1069 [Mobiluncus curtisii subsp. curtisii ATCC 35241]EFU81627.1 hypothetical protein HMPREF0576_1469 [Mobiluncus holmesii ATCC 35242]MCU9986562.1 hypothetical protein [Mobiluncus curtisii]MCV0000277.1 hypothetical protein [Mobiluncus curtisii]
MKDTSKIKFMRMGESASFGAMLTLITAVMFTVKSVDIPIWAWIIEFVILSGIAFVIPRQPHTVTPEQKRLLIFSSITAVLLIIALVVIIAVS